MSPTAFSITSTCVHITVYLGHTLYKILITALAACLAVWPQKPVYLHIDPTRSFLPLPILVTWLSFSHL